MKRFLFVIAFTSCVFAQNSAQNYTSYLDTTNIVSFRADTLRICKPFPLSAYENVRIDVMANDTGVAGFASDSVKFIWGFEVGHYVLNASNRIDTFWSAQRVIVDTMAIAVTAKIGPVYAGPIDSTGSYGDKVGRMDTSSVAGFIVQSRNFAPAWDVLIRPWALGLTGNNKSEFLNARFSIVRRAAVRVRAN